MSDHCGKDKPLSQIGALQFGRTDLFIRPRVNKLLTKAVKKPLVVVCAGMGYGKTIAVSDFVRECGLPTAWMQFSEFDNIGLSFWDTYTSAVEHVNKSLAEEGRYLGFPDTEDSRNQYFLQRDRLMANQRYLTVLDDVHLAKDAAVVNFLEHLICNSPPNRTIILICRELPQINISGLLVRGMVSNLNENDLNFTESELAQYLLQQGLSAEIPNLPEIFCDTEGWAFIINFMVRILKKTPGYTGHIRDVMKKNIFLLMEREAWNVISERLQRFLVRLSLVNRLSAELVSMMAEGDEDILSELNQQRVVYCRFDEYTGCYLIHHLFLDYLRSKQDILSSEEIYNTFKIAAEWCVRHGFNIDALNYYEKISKYNEIVQIIIEAPTQLLLSVASHLKGIFDRAPANVFDQTQFFACAHVRVLMLSGMLGEALDLLKRYEEKFLQLPDGDEFRNRSLGVLYYLWGVLRQLKCSEDDIYDFDVYYEKMSHYLTYLPDGQINDNYPIGPWINRVGVARTGAIQEYLDAIASSAGYVSKGSINWMEGLDDLGRAELFFYRGEINSVKPLIASALERAKRGKQFAIVSLVLFYSMRIAIWQGEYIKAEQALEDMEALLEENDFYNRFSIYDIVLGWYYYAMRRPEKIPSWLKGKFTPYSLTNLLDNFSNQIKARYYYMAKKYSVLLNYIKEQGQLESTLYGRIEMLAMEACVFYQMKDKKASYSTLLAAYEIASPNDIVMPFIEMGKDMRTLTLAAMHDEDCEVPEPWLKSINQKSSIYARHQAMVISEYKRANDLNAGIGLTHRETEVLNDLYKGFSRSEIAANQSLSINTVRLIVNTIYEKLKARNLVELIRIAHEQKLI
ncbi:MAG: LuxR C-terminal-related transcriptional regulator [Oscillospiraceae bacterium]|nr:LuxR C-terminal-related transcriptional regulator [Oscillospiraceae bacterium]